MTALQAADLPCEHRTQEAVKNGNDETIAMQCSCCLAVWPVGACVHCGRWAKLPVKKGRPGAYQLFCSNVCKDSKAAAK